MSQEEENNQIILLYPKIWQITVQKTNPFTLPPTCVNGGLTMLLNVIPCCPIRSLVFFIGVCSWNITQYQHRLKCGDNLNVTILFMQRL